MNFARFWEKITFPIDNELLGNEVTIWGASNSSSEAARTHAEERAKKFCTRFSSNHKMDEYEYSHDFIREEVLQEISSTEGKLLGVITRNHYGAEVLNTDQVFFGDIDAEQNTFGNKFLSIFGKKIKSKEYHLDKSSNSTNVTRNLQFEFTKLLLD